MYIDRYRCENPISGVRMCVCRLRQHWAAAAAGRCPRARGALPACNILICMHIFSIDRRYIYARIQCRVCVCVWQGAGHGGDGASQQERADGPGREVPSPPADYAYVLIYIHVHEFYTHTCIIQHTPCMLYNLTCLMDVSIALRE